MAQSAGAVPVRYLDQMQSSRRLDRGAAFNLVCMWLTSKLAPDVKTIAGFRRDDGTAITAMGG